MRWAAREYGVPAHGITLRKRQFDYAVSRIRAEGLENRVAISLCALAVDSVRSVPRGGGYGRFAERRAGGR